MRVSSPSSSSADTTRRGRALLTAAAGLLCLTALIGFTGGVVFDAGPLHVSLRHWPRPLYIDLLLWAALFALEGEYAARALRPLSDYITSRALLVAIVLAAAVAGHAIRYGGFAASGSDSGGYISQAELLSEGHVAFVEPLAIKAGWVESTWDFAPLGYRPSGPPGRIVPSYPPGWPATLVPARWLLGEWGPFLVAPLLGAAMVLAAYGLGARLHSNLAGLAAATLTATSPIHLFQVTQPMSDVPAAAWSTIAMFLATGSSPLSIAGAGFAGGLAVMARPAVAPLLIAIALVIRPWRRIVWFGVGGVPVALALAALQRAMYGNATSSGYGEVFEYFATANIAQNVIDYSRRIVSGELPALLITIVGLIVITIWRRRVTTGVGMRVVVPGVAAFAALLATYLPYGVFPEWYYLRFLLPALPALFVVIGSIATAAVSVVPGRLTGLAMSALLVTAAGFNLAAADAHQAWESRLSESRYQLTGKYVEASVPTNAVLLASQESIALHHYARRPVLRWDQLHTDLDAAVAFLLREGRHPVFVLEDWEHKDIRRLFPASPLARLDWQPRAHIGDQTHVYVYDLDDRDARHGRVDRIH